MATTRAKTGLIWLGSVGSGRWLVVGIVIVALLVGLFSTMIRGGESTDLATVDSYTKVKLSQVETLGLVVSGKGPRVGYTELKLNQIADLGSGGGAPVSGSDVYTRFKLDQVRGDPVTVPALSNLVE